MQLTSFPAIGLKGLLAADKPPVWSLSILEDSVNLMREMGDPQGVQLLENEIERIEKDLRARYG